MGQLKLFEFSDYRSYLEAAYRETKTKNPRWSFQAWAKHLRLANNTSLLKVIRGQREAGPEITQKICRYFRFSKEESSYFENLVRLSKAGRRGDTAEKLLIFEKIRAYMPRRQRLVLDQATFSVIAHWWCYAIRQSTRLSDFRPDLNWLQQRLNAFVERRDLRRAVQDLLRLGLLTGDESTFTHSGKGLNTLDDIPDIALQRFHAECLELTRASLDKDPPAEREISSVMLAMRAEDLPEAKAMIRKFQDDFCAAFERSAEERPNAVFNLQTQLIPIIKSRGESV